MCFDRQRVHKLTSGTCVSWILSISLPFLPSILLFPSSDTGYLVVSMYYATDHDIAATYLITAEFPVYYNFLTAKIYICACAARVPSVRACANRVLWWNNPNFAQVNPGLSMIIPVENWLRVSCGKKFRTVFVQGVEKRWVLCTVK